MAPVWIKVCGITNEEDAELAVAAGADAIGLNLVPSSKRYVDYGAAHDIVRRIGGRAVPVAVVADRTARELTELRRATGIDWLQLHGNESVAELEPLLPSAFKAARIGSVDDVRLAAAYPGERLLVDAKVEGVLGGSGHAFDWTLVTELAQRRPVILAGGLNPDNVGRAILSVRPWGVDVASGIEAPGQPRRKDGSRLRAFIAAVRAVVGT